MKLIDADELEKKWTIASPEPYSTDAAEVLDSIRGASTVDAVPVAHGQWLQADDAWYGLTTFQCSACGEEYCFEYAEDLPTLNYNYCPNCGAKMDLEDENDIRVKDGDENG